MAVILKAGAEKLRFINGYAAAVDSEGQRVDLFLDDIYQPACLGACQQFPGKEVTRAEY